jgi:hypothetical protein
MQINVADVRPGMKVRAFLPFDTQACELEVIESTGEYSFRAKILKMSVKDRPYPDCTEAKFGFFGGDTVEVLS